MQTILYEKQRQIAKIYLNRPEKRNAINRAMIADISEAFSLAAADTDVDLVILAGAGEKAFSAGFDLKEYEQFGRLDVEQARCLVMEEAEFIHQIAFFPKPVIAQVHGYCIGGGVWIALACDLIVASAEATFGQPESLLGDSPEFLLEMWKMPYNKMNEWLFTGKFYTAQEMVQMGVINQIASFAGLPQATLGLAEQVLKVERGTMRYLKFTISRCYELCRKLDCMNLSQEFFIQNTLYHQSIPQK
ncbi:MAG: enoyl-CoA hydratase/isomerase family protein [Bacillota bacterium]|nr:enoyl-CoA hydratase/isomerase family protein [Bacillota bacterium]